MSVDNAHEAARRLCSDVETRLAQIETEQDARLQLIDRFLTEVLGWEYADIRTERHGDSGFADYLIAARNQNQLVIEAKRTGRLLLDTVDPQVRWYKVGGPALQSASDGIQQGLRYSIDHGVNYTVLTTGITWIAFRPLPGTGMSYREGRALVFPTLTSILDNFAVFYDMFAKPAVIARSYTVVFAKDQGLSIDEFEPLVTANRKEQIHLVTPNALAADLEPVFKQFFGAMSAENDREMLIDCFVETRESRYADANLEKLVRSITTSIHHLGSSADSQLAEEIRDAVESGHGESVVIIGSSGAGKSTFVERFFDSVLDEGTRAQCLVVRLDLLRSTGDLLTIQSWLTAQLKSTIEKLLYEDGKPTFEELQGLYFREYQRWMKGPYKPLYETDKTAFRIKFGDYVNDQIAKDPYAYVLLLLENIVKSRKLLPCLIFDNGDVFDLKFQEAVFQYSQALRTENDLTFVVMPITDRSFWKLTKGGPFQTYQSKKFYLPIPPTKEVLERRVAYLRRKIDEDKDPGRYLLTRGIRLTMENIKGFAACLEEVFLREDFVARRISWLANNSIKRSLELTQRLIVSPHFSIDDLVKAYIAFGGSRSPYLDRARIMRALLLGSYNAYQADQNEFVVDVFEISQQAPTSPLLMLSILKMLIDRAGAEGEGIESYMSVEQCRQYFDAMRASEAAVNHTLQRLLNRGLIEPYDASDEGLESGQRVAITHSGRMHYELATTEDFYLREMAYSTPVRSADLVEELRSIAKQRKFESSEPKDIRSFIHYCLEQDTAFVVIPRDEIYDGQRQLRSELEGRWADRSERNATTADNALRSTGGSWSQISTVVKWYNSDKAYGFVEVGYGEDAFLHRNVLQQADVSFVDTGDTIVCDIAPGLKGRPQVIAVHSIQRKGTQSPSKSLQGAIEGTVEFYNGRKGYGFVKSLVLPEDVYVAARVLDEAGLRTLPTGARVRMRVEPGRFGKGYMASWIELPGDEDALDDLNSGASLNTPR